MSSCKIDDVFFNIIDDELHISITEKGKSGVYIIKLLVNNLTYSTYHNLISDVSKIFYIFDKTKPSVFLGEHKGIGEYYRKYLNHKFQRYGLVLHIKNYCYIIYLSSSNAESILCKMHKFMSDYYNIGDLEICITPMYLI